LKKIVILEIPHGQESNQLIQHIHFDAYCYLNNAVFINSKFQYLSKSIFGNRNFVLKIFVNFISLKYVRKTLIKIKIAKYHRFYSPVFQEEFDISFVTYVKDWYFRNNYCYNQIKPFYIDTFNSKLIKEDFFENNINLLIGVHIRRGDYINFLGGKYYLNDDQYIIALKNIIQDLNEAYKIIIFGNDPDLDKDLYLSLGPDLIISDGSIYEDYYRMSKCHFIIGPSSTFSIWAKFISNSKLKKIVIDKDNYCNVRLSDAI
jgi:hypothetical protein